MNSAKEFRSTLEITKKNDRDEATRKARKGFVIIMVIITAILWLFVPSAEAAEKKWFLSEVQYQISEDCSHDVKLFSHRAAQELSIHSVKFTEGLDAVYVTCEPVNPFINELRYLPPGVASEDEELTLGVTRTTWYTETMQIFRAHIWIDPNLAPLFGNLQGVVIHEWGHAVGEPHTFGGVMQVDAQGNHLDAATISRIRERYNKPQASVMDSEGDFYLSCLWVPSVIASLVGADGGFYWVQTKAGEIVAYGKTECG